MRLQAASSPAPGPSFDLPRTMAFLREKEQMSVVGQAKI